VIPPDTKRSRAVVPDTGNTDIDDRKQIIRYNSPILPLHIFSHILYLPQAVANNNIKTMAKKTFSQKDKAKAVQMMLDGNIPQKQIAKKFKCSLASLQQWKRAAQDGEAEHAEYTETATAQKNCKCAATCHSAKNGAADDFVRKYWSKNYRAVDMLLTPKDVSSVGLVKIVNEALQYAYDQKQK
jgi:Trp operon repressor